MDQTVDARGEACPLPVVKAKKALSSIPEGSVEVLVDNETAVHNLEALAKTMKAEAKSEQRGDAEYAVTITKKASAAAEGATCAAVAAPANRDVVAVISSPVMGTGDDELGATLMKGFIFALTQLDTLPTCVLFYNGGVKWSCKGSPALDDLKKLEEAGVQLLSCGTCLNHYGLTDDLAVGDVTNMYVIVDTQAQAGVVVRP